MKVEEFVKQQKKLLEKFEKFWKETEGDVELNPGDFDEQFLMFDGYE